MSNSDPFDANVSYLAVEGYRAFSKRVAIEVRPLTLLFGFNSVGKSALLRALPLLASSSQTDGQAPILLEAPIGRGASFNDLIARHHDRPVVTFELGWTHPTIVTISYEIRELPELRQQVINRIVYRGPEGTLEFLWEPELLRGESGKYIVKLDDRDQGTALITFEGLCPSTYSASSKAAGSALSEILRRMQLLSKRVHWLGALRDLVPRRETYVARPTRLGPRGERTTQAIAYDELASGALRETVSKWYEKATSNSLIVETSTASEAPLFSLKLVPIKTSPVRIDVVDTGEGMGQVLPVLSLCSMAALGNLGKSPIIAIEHPELHLQPSVHAQLAEHFISSVGSKSNPKFLVETHSENFLLRLQLAILNKEIEPADLVVYWIRKDEDGESTVERVDFNTEARPTANNWPTNAFGQSLEQARAIVTARQREAR